MSWSAASLVLLGIALAGGFAWYERSRPSSRLLAVVGTLAALAILGRIAFAFLPNVKPTTDIVLIAGYTLGGAPGFAVGAVTALVSNLFFGQGPWTPWQMGAWGLVGVLGAVLARASGGRLGRLPLALACGFAGLLYGAILDGSDWVMFSGEHTLGQYAVFAARGVPFNIAHAVGNVVFFCAFGPALIRAVRRCRTRFEVVWRPAGAVVPAALVVVVAGALLVPAAPAHAASGPSPSAAAARALAYLRAGRNADGGWGAAPGQSSNGLHTAWAAYALAAAGVQPDSLQPPTSPVLLARLDGSHAIGDVERTVMALRACGADPRNAGGRDLVAELLARQRRDGSFGGYVSYTAYAILALRAAGETRGVVAAARWLTRQADRDGGFNVYRRGGPSDADDTGYAIEALVSAGKRRSTTVRRAVAFLRRAQQRDGGWALSEGASSNAQSTAFALMGLAAARVDIPRVKKGGRSGLDYLIALQRRDGSIRYSRTSAQTPVWVTAEALVALKRQALPIVSAAPDGRRSSPPRAASRQADSTGRLYPGARGVGSLLALVFAAVFAT